MVSFFKRYQYHQIGTLPPAASHPPLSHLFSLRLLYLPYESPWLISLFRVMSGLFVSQPPFLYQVWPDLEWNQDSADRPGKLLRPLTHSYLLHLLGRLFLLALLFLLGICLPSLWSSPFPIHAPSLFMMWYSGLTALFLLLLAKVVLAYLPTASSVALRPLFPFQQAQFVQVFPLKPAPCCTLFADLGSTKKSVTSLLFSYYLTLVLSSPLLSSPPSFPFTWIFLVDLAGTVFSLLFYQATVGPRTLVSPRKRCGWWVGQTGSATCALHNPF